jgi:hypothetical protein
VYRCSVAFRFWISLIGVLLSIQSGIAEEDFRTWTSSGGKKLEAKYLSKIGEKIKIVTNRGKEFTVPLSRFSKEDQQYVANVILQESFREPVPFSYQKKGAVIIAKRKGKVQVGDYYEMKPAKVGQVVSTSQFIQTGSNGSAIVIFTNGTAASIAPKTHLIFQNIWQKQSISSPLKVSEIKEESSSCRIFLGLQSGELVVDAKKLKKDSSFVVNSPIVACGIRGTKFRFSASEERYNLSVLEGEVGLLDSRKQILSVRDKQIMAGNKTLSFPIQKMNDTEATNLFKSISKIKEVSSEYSLSQLQQVMESQNKDVQQKIPDPENQFPPGTSWTSKYNVWLKNPEPYGGRDTLSFISSSRLLYNLPLNLSRRKIQNISPLSDFTKHKILYLSSNYITNLTPLSNLTNLNTLSLGGNKITDLKPLSKLTNLNTLSLGGNKITDLKPLSKLTNLKSLSLRDNQITDLKPLSKLTNLTYLWLERNQITDLKPLSKLKNLTYLSLRDNQITDLKPLSKLTNLKSLSLRDNQVKDLNNQIKVLKSALPKARINF